MKKTLLATAFLGTLLVSCGDDKKESSEEKEKMCHTFDGVKAPCKDVEAVEKLEDLARELVEYSSYDEISYADAIATNEEIFKKMEPLLPSMEAIIKIDEKHTEERYVKLIAEARANMEEYKNILSDLENMEISATYEQDPVFEDELDEMIRFKNTSSQAISYLGGTMTYLDSAGNVLAEDEIGLYDFHFEPKSETGMAPGYEGVSDNGINCDKEKRALIHSIDIKIDEIKYYDPETEKDL